MGSCDHLETEVDTLLRDNGPGQIESVLVRYCKSCLVILEASSVETYNVEDHA